MAAKTLIRFVGMKNLRKSISRWERDFSPTGREMRILFNSLGRGGRDLVRRNITSQGGGRWAPLGKWARARTGRRKALITERLRVKYQIKGSRVEIGYDPKENNWNLTSHHKGFTTPGVVNKVVTVQLRNPAALGVSGNSITFRKSRPSVVPARNIWTSQQLILGSVVRPTTIKWVNRILDKRGR